MDHPIGVLDPLLTGVLVHLVGLDDRIFQRAAFQPLLGVVLQDPTKFQQVLAVTSQLEGQLGGRHALGEAAEEQHDLGGLAVGPRQGGAGEGVEDASAGGAAIVEHRGAMTMMDVEMVAVLAGRAGQAIGMEQADELVVAGVLIHEFDDREVHGVVSWDGKEADGMNLQILEPSQEGGSPNSPHEPTAESNAWAWISRYQAKRIAWSRYHIWIRPPGVSLSVRWWLKTATICEGVLPSP